jgi:hypothetical protein
MDMPLLRPLAVGAPVPSKQPAAALKLSLFESGLADAIDLAIFTYYFGRTNCP